MLAIGNEELQGLPTVYEGDKIISPETGEVVALQAGETVNADGTKTKTDLLLFYTLSDGRSFLAALKNKLLRDIEVVTDVKDLISGRKS